MGDKFAKFARRLIILAEIDGVLSFSKRFDFYGIIRFFFEFFLCKFESGGVLQG